MRKCDPPEFLQIAGRTIGVRIDRHHLRFDRLERRRRIERAEQRSLQRPDFVRVCHDYSIYRNYRSAIARYIFVHSERTRR